MTTDCQVARVIRTVEHDANLERVEATKIIASMKKSAGTRRAKPAQLYADHTQYATAHIRAEIGHQDAVKRTIRREKAKHLPKSPVSLSDLEVTGKWTTTGGVDKEDFLIHDSGPESASRILVFASQSPRTHPLGSPQRQDRNPLGSMWSTTSEATTKSHQTTTR